MMFLELWLEWLEDELKVMSTGDDREMVKRLFERAVKDYMGMFDKNTAWIYQYSVFSVKLVS